ncbi:MAG: hypothetical protein SNG35_01830 [Rikenellaceae bacterium]
MFESIPSNFKSLFAELNYSFVTSDDEREITISVYNADDNELCGTKRFYDSNAVSINIAPIIRNYAIPSAVKGDVGFVESLNSGFVSVFVEEGLGESADCRTFLFSRNDSTESEILTTMPLERTIAKGESEMVTIRSEKSSMLIARLRYYPYNSISSLLEASYQLDSTESGVAVFNFALESALLDGELAGVALEYITLTIEEHMEDESYVELAQIRYIVIDPPVTPTRLAWISSAGSIEHYTFPTIDKILRSADAKLLISLSSALEDVGMRRAISEIISSQRVWLDRGDCYEQVTITSEYIEIAKVRELERVSFTIECSDI